MKIKNKLGLWLIAVALPTLLLFLTLKKSESFDFPTLPNKKTNYTPEIINPHLRALLQDYDSAFQDLMRHHKNPGAAVAILHDSTVILLKGYGVKTLGTNDSIDLKTVFRLASVSKPFASFLTGILVQEKTLNWNDPILKHWPTFKLRSAQHTSQVTIGHVLSHSTGLPYHTYTNMIEEGLPFDTLLESLRDISLVSEPGKTYSYQNVGYSIIGKVVNNATHKTYQQQLKEKVFVPLDMNEASYDYKGLISSGNMAQPHTFKMGSFHPTRVNNTYYNVAPAGGINASITDMSKWLQALLGNREDLIKQKTLDTLFKPIVQANSRNRNFYSWQKVKSAHYGLGWRILHFPSDTLIYHGGYVTGYRSEVAILPSEKIAICILTNAAGPLADTSIPIFFKIFDRHRNAINEWNKNHLPNF